VPEQASRGQYLAGPPQGVVPVQPVDPAEVKYMERMNKKLDASKSKYD